MSLAASKLRQRRRDQERIFHDTQSFLDQHHNTRRLQDWEHRTQKQIEQREVDAITQKLLQQDEDELHQRKQQVQSLYSDEMSQWKQTLQSSLEVTPEERMEQIRKRAYELKEKRESERQQFVKECYERQWRDGCDDLRAFDSKATLDRIVKDRESMIQSKRIIEEQQRQPEDDANVMSLINKDESRDQFQRRQASLEFKRTLDHQVQWKRSRDESTTRQKQDEEQEQLRRLALLEQQAQESVIESIKTAKRGGDEMLRQTHVRAKERENRQYSEKEQNVVLLQHALDIERRRIQAEQAKKEVGKHAATEYVQCLREEAVLEEKESEHVNRIRDAEQKRISKFNDDKMMAEADAKRRWMEEVDSSRQEQIRWKHLEEEALRKELDQEAADAKAALLRAEEADQRDAEKAQALRMENMLANKATMDRRAKEREKKQQETYLIQNQIQNDQRIYQRRLEEQKK